MAEFGGQWLSLLSTTEVPPIVSHWRKLVIGIQNATTGQYPMVPCTEFGSYLPAVRK